MGRFNLLQNEMLILCNTGEHAVICSMFSIVTSLINLVGYTVASSSFGTKSVKKHSGCLMVRVYLTT